MCDNSVVTKAVPEILDYSVTVKTNTDGSRGMSAAVIVDSDSKKTKKTLTPFQICHYMHPP